MKSAQDFIHKAIEGLGLTEEQEKILVGFYLIKYYKSCLEILLTYKSNNVEFFVKMNQFLDDAILSLKEEQKKSFEALLEGEKGRILYEVIEAFKNQMEPQDKDMIDKNLDSILPRSPSNPIPTPAPVTP